MRASHEKYRRSDDAARGRSLHHRLRIDALDDVTHRPPLDSAAHGFTPAVCPSAEPISG